MHTESLTYRELATRLDVKVESARRMAQRKGWKRVQGNDGMARVLVPSEALERPEDKRSDDAGDDHPLRQELEARIEILKELVSAERRRAEAAEADRDAWRSQAQRGFLKCLFG